MSNNTIEDAVVQSPEKVCDALSNESMVYSLIDMLNAISSESDWQDEEFESALEQIAYQKIKEFL
ncbi:hypothetical protein NLG07_08740 [Alteromonas sp. LMIT006]|jgi:hypothetical protein|uniref:hypothetical protein n=1 Tax=Alteromonadaceae TaxID=72275 RepID=UPI0020CA6B16|nr:hypothetical protein [Alteromonas sp. LMIT006]UTP72083.1 hypothetical protein NLG07_08740 [Alteromonas sp. LMIT006]